ncbi:hypothetical protein KEM56_006683 [Ascosphaera pollenicola]|nr:hypothetical protein KEM56_006683 [Ascosphaera pollenicola]
MERLSRPSPSHSPLVDHDVYKQTWASSTSTLTNDWNVNTPISKFDRYTIDDKTGRPIDKKLSRALEWKLDKIGRGIHRRHIKLAEKTSRVLELIPQHDVNIHANIRRRLALLGEIDDLEKEIQKLQILQDSVREQALDLSDIDQQRKSRGLDQITATLWSQLRHSEPGVYQMSGCNDEKVAIVLISGNSLVPLTYTKTSRRHD